MLGPVVTLVTAQGTDKPYSHYKSPQKGTQDMTGERKLWLCVVMQGLAERDPMNVVTNYSGATRLKAEQKRAQDARSFVESEDFDRACHLADLDPAIARTLSPSQAHAIYYDLLTPDCYNTQTDDTEEFEAQDRHCPMCLNELNGKGECQRCLDAMSAMSQRDHTGASQEQAS